MVYGMVFGDHGAGTKSNGRYRDSKKKNQEIQEDIDKVHSGVVVVPSESRNDCRALAGRDILAKIHENAVDGPLGRRGGRRGQCGRSNRAALGRLVSH